MFQVEASVVLGEEPEGADAGIRVLRDELLELDVQAVEQAVQDPAPPHVKGFAGGSGSTLIVTLSDSAVLVALVRVLRSWLVRDRSRKVTIRIGEDSLEVARASEQEQARLIEAWLSRHAE